MEGSGLIERAVVFAARKHAGQVRKGSKVPYLLHPLECAVIVATMTNSTAVIAAAVLHDVLEDTPATREELLEHFGPEITELVCAESEDKRPGQPKADTWRARKQETLDRLQNESRNAQIIALGDKLANLRAIRRDLETMGDALWQRFNQKDPAQHAWYYRAVGRCLSSLACYPAYREYMLLLDQVFGPEPEK